MMNFKEAQENAFGLKKRPTDKELLRLYGLYKQAVFGNNETPEPSFLDFKARSKWEAWDDQRGLTKETAEKLYIRSVSNLMIKYNHE